MRVPVYESKVRTQAIDAPKVGVAPTGLDDLAKGISKVGAVAANIGEDLEREREKARATQGTMALNDLEREITDAFYADSDDPKKRGFKLTNGVDAFSTGRDAATKKRIADFAAKRAAAIPDEVARARTLEDFNKRLVYVDRDIEQHTGAQREVAEKVELASLEDVYVASAVRDGAEASEPNIVALLDKKARLARAPEEVVAYERALRGRMYESILRDQIDRDDIDAADEFLKTKERWIPAGIADKARTVIKDRRLDKSAETIASMVVDMSTDSDGKPNLDAMVVPDDVEDVDLKERAGKLLAQRRSLEDKRWEGEKDTKFNDALGAYLKNKRGGIAEAGAGGRRAWMQKHDSESWLRIERIIQADADRWRSLQARGGSGPSEAEQNAMLELQVDMARNPKKYRDADYTTAKFSKEWAERIGVDNLEQAGGKWASEIRRKEEKDVLTTAELMREVDSEVVRRGLEGKRATAKSRELARKARARAAAGDASGKPQSIEEIRDWLSGESTEKGIFWDSKVYTTDKPGSERAGFDEQPPRESAVVPVVEVPVVIEKTVNGKRWRATTVNGKTTYTEIK